MREEMRTAGFTGPTAVIPHGAWIPRADRNSFRHKLGLDEVTPLVGIFGYLKPYKRIAESLRAFRRLPVSYTHLRAHETRHDLVCRLLLEKKKKAKKKKKKTE